MSSSFRPTKFLKPQNEEELLSFLRANGRARIIAGGTGVYDLVNRGLLAETESLIDITESNLSFVNKEGDAIRIGASTTMTDIIESGRLDPAECGALLDALRAIQPLQVKNVATIGGNVCIGLPFFDLPPALMALDASVVIAPGDRKVKVLEFVKGYFEVDLTPGEYVKEFRLPLGGRSSAFQKFALTRDDWAIVNCAASLSVDDARRMVKPILVFGGGVGEKPKRATRVEESLHGLREEGDIRHVMDEVLPQDLETITDMRASAEYRMEIARTLGRRTIMAAFKKAT